MVKQTQTIIWQQLTNCLSVFSHFKGSTLKELRGSFLANFPVPRQKSTTVALRHMCYQLFPTISKIIPSRGVLIKRYSKNMHQICRGTPMANCDFNKIHGCSPANVLRIFRTSFHKNTYREILFQTLVVFNSYLILIVTLSHVCHFIS